MTCHTQESETLLSFLLVRWLYCRDPQLNDDSWTLLEIGSDASFNFVVFVRSAGVLAGAPSMPFWI
jgi:hypothetical protein